MTRLLAAAVAALLILPAAGAQAAPGFLNAIDLSPSGAFTDVGDAAADGAGNVTVAWEQGSAIRVARRPAGSPFVDTQIVSGTPSVNDNPRLAVNAEGDTLVVWREGASQVVMAAFRPAGGSFGPPEPISGSETGVANIDPAAALDADGNALVVWVGRDGASSEVIRLRRRAANGSLSTVSDLSASGQNSSDPDVVMSPAGDALISWLRAGNAEVRFRSAAGALDATQTTPANAQVPLTLDMAPDGTAVAAWVRNVNAGTRVVEAARRPAGTGSTFDGPNAQPLFTTAVSDPVEIDLRIDGTGAATVSWIRNVPGGGRHVQAAARPPGAGQSFGAAQTLDVFDEANPPALAELAVGSQGQALVAWQRTVGVVTRVEAAARPAGAAAFTAPKTLSAAGVESVTPEVATDGQGHGVVAWRFGEASAPENHIQVAPFDEPAPALQGLNVPASGTPGAALPFSVAPVGTWSPVTATTWSFGDGGSASGTDVSHAYSAPGTYTVTVTATDAAGNTNSTSRSVSIADSSAAPPGGGTPPPGGGTPPPGGSAPAAQVRIGRRATARNGRILVTLSCPGGAASGPCSGTIRLRSTGRRPVTLGSARFRIAAGDRAVARVRLTRAGRRLLAGRRRVAVRATAGDQTLTVTVSVPRR